VQTCWTRARSDSVTSFTFADPSSSLT
jgi:hypothetical protein